MATRRLISWARMRFEILQLQPSFYICLVSYLKCEYKYHDNGFTPGAQCVQNMLIFFISAPMLMDWFIHAGWVRCKSQRGSSCCLDFTCELTIKVANVD